VDLSSDEGTALPPSEGRAGGDTSRTRTSGERAATPASAAGWRSRIRVTGGATVNVRH